MLEELAKVRLKPAKPLVVRMFELGSWWTEVAADEDHFSTQSQKNWVAVKRL